MESKYVSALDDLRFSDDAKAQMVERLVVAADAMDAGSDAAPANAIQFADGARMETATPQSAGKPPRRQRKHNLRIIAAAIAAAAVIAAGGVAYASGALITVQQAVDDIFNGAPAQTEIIDKIGRPIDAIAENGGITMTADTVIGDATHCAVVYSLVRDDGEPFDVSGAFDDGERMILPYTFRASSIKADTASGSASGSYYVYDADPNDSAIQLVSLMEFNIDKSLVGSTIYREWRDLLRFDGQTGQRQTIAEGTWHLKFKLNYEDAGISFPTGQTFDLNGMTATVDSLTVSPIAFSITYTVDSAMPVFDDDGGKMGDENNATLDRYLGTGTITFHLADGTSFSRQGDIGGSTNTDGDVTHCENGFFFDRVIDAEQVVAVTIGGMTIARA